MNTEKEIIYCVQCDTGYPKWELETNPIRYCCLDCWRELERIECWGTSKRWKKYMKKRKKIKAGFEGLPVWCTICPTKDCNFVNFDRIMNKLIEGTLIKSGFYTYEWRHYIEDFIPIQRESLDNNGLHLHGYFKVSNVNSFKTKVKRCCKKHGWIYNDKTVINCEYPKQDKIDYITGKVGTLEKKEKKQKDKLLREKIGWGQNVDYIEIDTVNTTEVVLNI